MKNKFHDNVWLIDGHAYRLVQPGVYRLVQPREREQYVAYILGRCA